MGLACRPTNAATARGVRAWWCRLVVLAGILAGVFVGAAAFAAVPPASSPASAAPPTSARKNILILSGVQFGLPANEASVAAIVNRLKERGVSLNDIYYERLDLARSSQPDQQQKLAEFLKGKLDPTATGAVIVVGQPAMRFLAGIGSDTVTPGTPVVTALVSQPAVPWTGTPRPTLAIPDRVDAAGTLRAALTVFPNTQRVVVVAGRPDIQRPYLDTMRKALAELPRQLGSV